MYAVISLGGVWFWLLVLAEVVFLYNCMGLERTKGANATASLIGFFTLLFCFSNLKTWAVENWGWTTLAYFVGMALVYVSLGVMWSFFWMWPRWGKKRKQIHKKKLTEWLETPAGVVAQIQGHKPSATAEKHYKVRPLELLRVHHEKIEA